MEKKLKILMIGAHPDDDDGCGGGTALKYVKRGHEVRFLSVSDGRCGHHEMSPEALIARRRAEADEVARIAGLQYDVWDIPDGEVVATLENRRRMICYIRAFNPDVIFTHRTNDYHADHRNVALLVQDASYLLQVPNLYPEAPAMRRMPVIVFFADRFKNPSFRADVVVPIDGEIDGKYDLLNCHVSQYFEWLPYTAGKLEQVPATPEERYAWFRAPLVPRDRVLCAEDMATPFPHSHSEYREARPSALYRDKLREQYGDEAADKVLFSEAFEISEYGRQPKREEYAELFAL